MSAFEIAVAFLATAAVCYFVFSQVRRRSWRKKVMTPTTVLGKFYVEVVMDDGPPVRCWSGDQFGVGHQFFVGAVNRTNAASVRFCVTATQRYIRMMSRNDGMSCVQDNLSLWSEMTK